MLEINIALIIILLLTSMVFILGLFLVVLLIANFELKEKIKNKK